MENWAVVVLAVALVIAIAAAAWLYWERRKTQRLQRRFGPEYERALSEHGDRRRAEAVLEKRAERIQHLEIRRLPREQRDRFLDRWRATQTKFVDDPRGAVTEADRLVGEVMSARGYPVADFEQQAADLSVEHPMVVENYRAAHEIAVRHERGQASTEDLRQAMVYYRRLFEDLLEARTEVER